MPQSKTPRPTARELDQAIREEAADNGQAPGGRTPLDAFGSSTQEFEPFASEAPAGPSERERNARASFRRTIAVHERHGKPHDQIEADLLSCPGNDLQMEQWIREEVDRARKAMG